MEFYGPKVCQSPPAPPEIGARAIAGPSEAEMGRAAKNVGPLTEFAHLRQLKLRAQRQLASVEI